MKKNVLAVFFLAVSPLVWAQPQPMSDRQTAEEKLRDELRRNSQKTDKALRDLTHSVQTFEQNAEARRIVEEKARNEKEEAEQEKRRIERKTEIDKQIQERKDSDKRFFWVIALASFAVLVIFVVIFALIRRNPKIASAPIAYPNQELELSVNPTIGEFREKCEKHNQKIWPFVLELEPRGSEFDGMRFNCVGEIQDNPKLDPLVTVGATEPVGWKNAPKRAVQIAKAKSTTR